MTFPLFDYNLITLYNIHHFTPTSDQHLISPRINYSPMQSKGESKESLISTHEAGISFDVTTNFLN